VAAESKKKTKRAGPPERAAQSTLGKETPENKTTKKRGKKETRKSIDFATRPNGNQSAVWSWERRKKDGKS